MTESASLLNRQAIELASKGEYKEALQNYAATVSGYKATPDEISEALYKLAYCYYKL